MLVTGSQGIFLGGVLYVIGIRCLFVQLQVRRVINWSWFFYLTVDVECCTEMLKDIGRGGGDVFTGDTGWFCVIEIATGSEHLLCYCVVSVFILILLI